MTIIFDNQNRAQNEYVAHWLKVALENAQSAVLLSGSPSLGKYALAHVQQSAEIATKGIALGMGMPYKDVKASGHNNLKLSGKIMMDKFHLIESFLGLIMPDDMVSEISTALDAILKPTDDFKISMQLASPSDVKKALDLIDNMSSRLERDARPGVERSVREVVASFNVSDLYRDNSDYVFPPGIANWLESRGIDADALKAMFFVVVFLLG